MKFSKKISNLIEPFDRDQLIRRVKRKTINLTRDQFKRINCLCFWQTEEFLIQHGNKNQEKNILIFLELKLKASTLQY